MSSFCNHCAQSFSDDQIEVIYVEESQYYLCSKCSLELDGRKKDLDKVFIKGGDFALKQIKSALIQSGCDMSTISMKVNEINQSLII